MAVGLVPPRHLGFSQIGDGTVSPALADGFFTTEPLREGLEMTKFLKNGEQIRSCQSLGKTAIRGDCWLYQGNNGMLAVMEMFGFVTVVEDTEHNHIITMHKTYTSEY